MRRAYLLLLVAACGTSADDTVVDASLDQSQEATAKDATADVTKQDASPDVQPDVGADVSDATVDTILIDSPPDAPPDSPPDVIVDSPIDVVSDASVTCNDNNDCQSSEYCDKGTANCAGTGVCMTTPSICPLFYSPVCGCDKQTHNNTCDAHKNRTSVDYTGMCE